MDKRASLEISISTIVLLVLALALVGIVVGSFTGLFSVGKNKLLDSISSVDASVKATSSDVLAGGDAFSLPRSKYQVITTSFYNGGHPECEVAAQIIFYCPDVRYVYDSVSLSVPIGQEKTLGGVLKINPLTKAGLYVCQLRVRCGGSPNQVIVESQHSVFKVN
ncbi:MAG: hypothetical protein KC535_03560 [Nanoarchaeota archaeon]|nr:hypothetical protein [Nanoarchaeota archaeon]